MNRLFLVFTLAAATLAASAQTAVKSKAAAVAHTPAAAASNRPIAPWIKLPPGVPKVAHGPLHAISIVVRYEDIKVGTGAAGEPHKLWHIQYTGWRAADGVQFDASADHKSPLVGKDGKPELGPDGKPKMEAQPMVIPQGVGAVIPGFDYGLAGMKIGGKRRIFIPWQMAYGTRVIPDRPGHPGIPAQSDLIFDVELVDVTAMPAPRSFMMPMRHPAAPSGPGASAQTSAAPGQHPAAAPSATTQTPEANATPAATKAATTPKK